MSRAVLLLALAAMGGAATAKPVEKARAVDWRRVATDADRTKVRNWRDTWLAALTAARAVDPAGVAAEGALLDPDRALDQAIPPVGTYRCRTVKLGTKNAAVRGFTAFPAFDCRIADDKGQVAFAKISGSQRPVGRIYKDGEARGVFLGTLSLGEESGVLKYGRDVNRDMVGLVQRIGPRRWRIAFPDPRFESQLDVIELVPAG